MIHKEQLSVRSSAPTLLTRHDARARGGAGLGRTPVSTPRNRAVVTSILRSKGENLDDGIWIDVDAPAQALRRAEALARIRRREAAILHAFGGASVEPPVWHEIPVERSPVHRPGPALAFGEGASASETRRPLMTRVSMAVTARVDNAPQPCRAPATPLRAEACRRGFACDVVAVPSLNLGFIAVLVSCSMLAWLVAWVILRFCQ